ncbi:MAG: endonuclease [Desulfurellales bacterium]|nr:MAG: endonuclease [Desulfurellales bacterium]
MNKGHHTMNKGHHTMNATAPNLTPDRTLFIGGSDAAAILGISKWKTPFQLYQEKTGAYVEDSTPMRDRVLARGKRWEPVVVEMLIDELEARGHDVKVIGRNLRYQDAQHPFLACELDLELLIDGEEVNGEMKTVHPFAAKEWGTPETDEIPLYYAAQVMHGLMIKPRRRALVAALIGADDLRIYFMERDEETIAAIRSKEIEFWHQVQTQTPPDPTAHADLNWLYRKDTGSVAEADDATMLACQQLKDMKAEAKALETRIDEATALIKARMGDAATLLYRGNPVATWKNNKDSVVTDWKGLALDYWPDGIPADLLAQHTTTRPGARPFNLK